MVIRCLCMFTNNSYRPGRLGGEGMVSFAYRYGQGTASAGTNFYDSFNNECRRDVWNWTEEDLYQGDYIAERSATATTSPERVLVLQETG